MGELTYNEEEGCWKRKIFLGIWGGDNYPLELMVKCGKDEEITEIQRDAYNSYLASLSAIAKEVPYLIIKVIMRILKEDGIWMMN